MNTATRTVHLNLAMQDMDAANSAHTNMVKAIRARDLDKAKELRNRMSFLVRRAEKNLTKTGLTLPNLTYFVVNLSRDEMANKLESLQMQLDHTIPFSEWPTV